MTKGDNCDACNALKNRVFPISQAKAGENLAPLHLNCDCKTAILDKNGKIAILAEDQLDKLLGAFDFSRPWEKKNRIGKNDTGQLLPPLFTSDGVKITSKNKENKDTWDYFIKYVYNKVDGYSDSLGTPVYTLYLAWLEETYGENKRENLWGWLDQMISQITLGNYEENTTIPGIIGQILLGLTDLDLPADLRDLSYDLIYWEISKEHFGQTALDVIGLLPLVGALKYGDEAADSVGATLKHGDEIGEQVVKHGDKIYNILPKNDSQLKHIFREAEGHLPDTPVNRALIENTANNPLNFLGKDKHGVCWYAQIKPDGSQIWVKTYDGIISNGGVNKTPILFDPETGLNKNPFIE